MAELSEKEIRILNREIERQGLTYTELQQELLDHLCCDVEAEMEEGLAFVKALEKVRNGMGEDRIRQVQEETLLLVNQKYRIMKKLMYVLGMLAPVVLIIGTIFKTQHWLGAGILITLSLFLLGAIYLPLFVMVRIRDTRKKGKPVNMPMYVAGMIAGIVFIAGAMFKIQHWPGAGTMLTLTAVVTVLVFIPILVVQALRDKENQVQHFTVLIFVLAFAAVWFMTYALRVSRNVLDAFTMTAQNLERTTGIIENRNEALADRFDLFAPSSEILGAKVEEINRKADELDAYIRDMKVQMVMAANGDNRTAVTGDRGIDYSQLDEKDNTSSVETVIFGDQGIPGKGEELKGRISEYREFLQKEADPDLAGMIGRLLDTGSPEEYLSWEEYCFRGMPMMSAVTMLGNMQTGLRFAQGEVLSRLLLQQAAGQEISGIP